MNQRILAYETSELDRTTLLPIILYIILLTPTPVNVATSTFAFWSIIEGSVGPILPVTRTDLPRLLDLDLDYILAWTHIVVVVERNHTIDHFRVDKKPCLH